MRPLWRLSLGVIVTGLIVVVSAAPARAEREHFQLKVGPTYDQGDFGTDETTRTFFFPVTLRYLGERWDFGVTVPFVYLDSPRNVTIVEGTPTRTAAPTRERVTEAGLGDVAMKARFFVVDDPGPNGWWPALTPFLKLKIPTADETRGLGTGEFDGGFGLEFDKTFGRLIVFGDVSYTFMGDPPGQDFNDRPGASLGLGYRVTDIVTLTGLMDWRRALISGNDDPVELMGIVSVKFTPTLTVSPYAFAGLTNGSPDFGVGFEVSYRFGRW